jgi:O-antigen ligase
MTRAYFPKIDNETLYILPLLLLLATDSLFYPFPYLHGGYEGFGSTYADMIDNLVKIAGPISAVLVVLNITKYKRGLLFITFMALIYLVTLVFESLYLYNSPLQYPHVILKLFNLFVMLALFAYYINRPSANFPLIMTFIMLGLLMQLVLQPKMLTLQAFVTHDRGLPATSVFLLCLPCIYFFNQYMTDFEPRSLILFLFLLIFILLANHRSVWATIAFCLVVNIIVLRKNIHFNVRKVLGSLALLLIIAGFVFSIAMSYSSDVEEKVERNIKNILNPTEDKTGSWRLDQMKSYWPTVKNNFFTGMRWKGFELPVQFYHTEAGTTVFTENTGHHFHNFYFDKLFYFGILGVIVYFLAMLWPVAVLVKYNLRLNNIVLSFFIFCLGGLVFGMAYNLPFSYWLIFGVTIALVNKALQDSQSELDAQA